MKYPIYFLSIILLLGCQEKQNKSTLTTVYNPIYAQTFKLLSNDQKDKIIRIYHRDQDRLTDSIDIDLGNKSINRVIPLSSTFISYIEALDALDKIVGFPNFDYVSSEDFIQRADQGLIQDIGMENPLNYERILQLNPDLILSFSLDKSNYETSRALGLNELSIEDWKENNPLGRMEYLILYGYIFDRLDLSIELFKAKEKAYMELKKTALVTENKPSCISGTIFQGIWYSPAGGSYVAKLYQDAGFDYVYGHTTGSGSLFLDPEDVLVKGSKADYWFSPDLYTSKEALLNDQNIYGKFKALKEDQIYGYANKKASNDALIFFNEVPMYPERILKDLITIKNPDLFPDYQPFYLEKLN